MGAASSLLRVFRVATRHAGPHLLEATLGPTACFLTGRALWGVDGALAMALAWTGGAMALRQLRGRSMSGLLAIGLTTLLLRAAASFAMHSERAYLIAPALVTIIMGAVYLGSAVMNKPLLRRVLGDLVPPRWLDAGDPEVSRLCRVGSAVWGVEQILVAAVSLAMILRVSTTTYLMTHELVSWLVFVVVTGAVVPFFWGDLRSLAATRRARRLGAGGVSTRAVRPADPARAP